MRKAGKAGRFVIATNKLDVDSFSSDEILGKYKEQQAPERGFAFLKDPLFLIKYFDQG